MLPRSLKFLGVFWPIVELLPRLNDLAEFRTSLPNLCNIDLYTKEGESDSYELYEHKHHPVYNRWNRLGVKVVNYYDSADERAEWNDADYDPFICDVVAWSEELKTG
jgi:hypothetical protein